MARLAMFATMMNRYQSLIVFLVGVVGIGWVIGATNLPGTWYASLSKPAFNPPDWLFPVVWTVIYVMIALAGWRTWLQENNSLALQLWFAQMLLNFSWSPVFFRLHNMGFGLAIILALLATIVGFIVIQSRDNRLAASLFAPYAVWVAFASTLNYSLLRLN
jgi:tryptophan-rich sensory protein